MDKLDYLNALKNTNMSSRKIKSENSESIIMENESQLEELSEIFIQSGEIAALPSGAKRDMQILRLGIIAELDAANLYEKLALLASNKKLKKVLLDVSREEKVHFGEFEELLETIDPEFEKAEEEGEDEVNQED